MLLPASFVRKMLFEKMKIHKKMFKIVTSQENDRFKKNFIKIFNPGKFPQKKFKSLCY